MTVKLFNPEEYRVEEGQSKSVSDSVLLAHS